MAISGIGMKNIRLKWQSEAKSQLGWAHQRHRK
jgi:hypothetical protein